MALAAEDTSDLPGRLLAHRRRYGLSQAQLAARIGATPQTLGRWESGAPPQIRWLAKIDEELNPPRAPAVLAAIDGRPPRLGQLTRLQERAIEAYLSRIEAPVPMSVDEIAGFKTVFSQVGIAWAD